MEESAKARRRNDVGPTGLQVAANVRRWREHRRLTTMQLSQRLEELGRPIQASGITKIEKGGRQVTVDDLIVIAVALEIDVPSLLLPATLAEDASITGAGKVPGPLARAFVGGDSPLLRPEDDPDGRKLLEYRLTVRPVWDASRNVYLRMRERLDAATADERDHG